MQNPNDCGFTAESVTVCTQAVDFYLDDRYTRERQALVALCKNENSSSKEIMGYIWEAYSQFQYRADYTISHLITCRDWTTFRAVENCCW